MGDYSNILKSALAPLDTFSKKYPGTYFALRVLLAGSTLFAMHLFGYIHRLGIGVRPFIGAEVATDLLADITYAFFVSAAVGVLTFFVLTVAMRLCVKLIKRFFSEPQRQLTFVSAVIALFAGIYTFLKTYFGFGFWWTASFGYGVSNSALCFSTGAFLLAGVMLYFEKIGAHLAGSVVLVLFLNWSYFFGAVKAGSVPEYNWKQIVFLDDTRLDGYPLHRVSDGIIFRKRDFFALDTGAVFVPFSSFKFITEPAVDSGGDAVLSRDYPGTVRTAP